ncbi:MAG: alpha/beta fold hydrolase [Gammaproteobacteria bacterium]
MPRSLTLPCWMVLAALVAALAAPFDTPAHSQVPARTNAIETLATAPDRFFTEGGVRIRYRDFGRGEPVVMTHGYTDRLEMWTGLADSLASTHRVIALDARGFGLSSKPADPAAYGMPMADDVARLLGHLRIGRAHLVGYSMGAAIAGNLVARYPSRVATASLIGGPFFQIRRRGPSSSRRISLPSSAGKDSVPSSHGSFRPRAIPSSRPSTGRRWLSTISAC